ncbi:MAG: tRNA pseudouridine(13) synthase TruD [Desulfurococcales archaeon]|nr:tRNA pseudouridine(13) synthase TruD [Desulfurococcales archaeon]
MERPWSLRWRVNDILEELWGTLEWLEPGGRPKAVIPRPNGFLVAEPRPLTWSGGWTLYYIRKKDIPTEKAARILAWGLGAKKYSYYGLKDSQAIAYQSIALLRPEQKPRHIILSGRGWTVEAWLIADGVGQPVKGLHGWNSFNITLLPQSPTDPPRPGWTFPNYYGPQRFGVCRPNTHIIGLYLAKHDDEGLREELASRYPLEPPRKRRDALNSMVERLALQALQAYIWNKALSTAIRENLLERVKERARPVCPKHSETRKHPLLPLPSRRMGEPKWWRETVEYHLEREELEWETLRGLKPSPRLATAEPCTHTIKVVEPQGAHVHTFTLPRGSYATVMLREKYALDWVSECTRLLAARMLTRRKRN